MLPWSDSLSLFVDAIPIRGKFIVIVPVTQKEKSRINEYNEYILYTLIFKKGTCKWTKLFLVIAQIYVIFPPAT